MLVYQQYSSWMSACGEGGSYFFIERAITTSYCVSHIPDQLHPSSRGSSFHYSSSPPSNFRVCVVGLPHSHPGAKSSGTVDGNLRLATTQLCCVWFTSWSCAASCSFLVVVVFFLAAERQIDSSEGLSLWLNSFAPWDPFILIVIVLIFPQRVKQQSMFLSQEKILTSLTAAVCDWTTMPRALVTMMLCDASCRHVLH